MRWITMLQCEHCGKVFTNINEARMHEEECEVAQCTKKPVPEGSERDLYIVSMGKMAGAMRIERYGYLPEHMSLDDEVQDMKIAYAGGDEYFVRCSRDWLEKAVQKLMRHISWLVESDLQKVTDQKGRLRDIVNDAMRRVRKITGDKQDEDRIQM